MKKLDEHQRYLKNLRNQKIIVVTFQVAIILVVILLWQILTKLNILDDFLFSSPKRIVLTIKDLTVNGNIFSHIGITLLETILGFLIATFTGSLIAVILWFFEKARRVFEPYIVVLNSLPKIALGPLIIIWFGAGMNSIIFMAVIITIIVTIINMLNGFLMTDENKILLLKSMGATKLQILFKLVLPQTLPTFISTLKINVGMSWIGSIMGEYLVSRQGLGYLIVYGGQVFKLDLVMSSTVILCMLSALMYLSVALLEKFLIKNRQ